MPVVRGLPCTAAIAGRGAVAECAGARTASPHGGAHRVADGAATAIARSTRAHLNPAVTLALAYLGKLDWSLVPGYILAQFLGAMLGAALVWLMYRAHFDATAETDLQLACFEK
ncbi:MAG: hypothetical protein EBS99_12700, partial [Betaproteobacteria bacterium]|nr:hypothetical protein [Betaproteobacteria bacterium]